MKFATEAIHSSYDCDEHNRAIMPPIYQNSMFAMHEIGEQIPYRYSRVANPTRKVLEDTMAALERGAAGFAFASGMAGIDAVWRTFLRPGDTIVAVADIYGGAYDLLTEVYAAGEEPIVAADSRALARAIRVMGKLEPIYCEAVHDLPATLLNVLQEGDVVLTMGAGSINKAAQALAEGSR